MKLTLTPRAVAPEIAFQLTEGCPAGQPPDWCLAWPSRGRAEIRSDQWVRDHFDIAADPPPSAATWTTARRARGAVAFLYTDRDGEQIPVSPACVVTLLAAQRAGAWATTAAVAGERADLMDTTPDRTSSCLSDAARAGLVDKRQDPARRARAYVWRINDAGAAVIESHGAKALEEVHAPKWHTPPDPRDDCIEDLDDARLAG